MLTHPRHPPDKSILSHLRFNNRENNFSFPDSPAKIANFEKLPLFVAWYNFGRKHETLKGKTPAMACGLGDHVWTIRELVERSA